MAHLKAITSDDSATVTARIDVGKLRSCSMRELGDFRQVVHQLSDMLSAFNCQPRFGNEEANRLNTAGELLDDICSFMNHLEDEAVKMAKAASPDIVREAEYRAWTILGYEADCADDLNEFAVLAVTAARDAASAQFAERHALRRESAA